MSKYTQDELRTMAKQFLEREQQGDFRCLKLLTILQALTGLSHKDVMTRITYLSV